MIDRTGQTWQWYGFVFLVLETRLVTTMACEEAGRHLILNLENGSVDQFTEEHESANGARWGWDDERWKHDLTRLA